MINWFHWNNFWKNINENDSESKAESIIVLAVFGLVCLIISGVLLYDTFCTLMEMI